MAEQRLTSPLYVPAADHTVKASCFFLKCSHRGQILPSDFTLLLLQHQCNTIILRHHDRHWPVTIANDSFGEGWDEYQSDNIVKKHATLLLRHIGNLIFDVIHFSELQMQVFLSWTAPLPHILQTPPTNVQVYRQRSSSSISPEFSHNLTDTICFYQVFSSAYPNTLKIPRFVDYFINDEKTPTLLIKTGNMTTEIGIKHKRLKMNWRNFVRQHDLHHNDILVFLPESKNVFTVIVFNDDGVEKLFPWYHGFNVYSISHNQAYN